MSVRNYASFKWSTEHDGEFDSAGNVVSPGGRGIAEYIQQSLALQGLQVSTPENHEDYGWAFDAIASSVRVWCLVQYAEPWLLITDVPSRWLHKLRGRDPDAKQRNVSHLIQAALASSGQATGIRWFTRSEFDQSKGTGGVESP